MKLLWLLLVLIAIADSTSVSCTSVWRQTAIELVQKAIDCLEGAQLPEDSRLLPDLKKVLDYLGKKLADLQDSSMSLREVNRFGFLQKVFEKIENVVSRLPGGPLKDCLQQVADRIHKCIDSVRPSDVVVVNETVRNRLNNIQQLIESHRHSGMQFLRDFLNSDKLKRLVSQTPEPIQSEVRRQIAELMDSVASM